MTLLRRLLRGLPFVLAALTAAPAWAADPFPTRPITLLIPFTAGGPNDVQYRMLANQATKVFGVPVVVDNKPGAGGTLAPATMAATAKPDGYTIGNLPTGIYSVPHMQKVSFDPRTDFTYIMHVAGWRTMVLVGRDAPWKTWKELIADVKAKPGGIPYGIAGGPGASGYMSMESIMSQLGLKMTSVPFAGISEVFAALIGGHVQVGGAGAGAALPHIQSGTIRPLLSNTKERNPKFPDVPSLTDEGIILDIDLLFPHGMGGPKGMDPAIVKTLHDGLKKAYDTPEHMTVLDQLDEQPYYLDSEAYRAFALQQYESQGKLLAKLGLARAK